MKIIFAFCALCCFSLNNIAQNKFTDITQQKIYDLQDKRQSKLLLPYLTSKNAFYRYTAVLAYASVQDSTITPHLFNRLKVEKFTEIRMAAAYAIGQLRNAKFCNQLIAAYKKEKNTKVKNVLMEAIGKSANTNAIVFFEENLPQNDSLLTPYLKALLQAKRKKISSINLKQYVLNSMPNIILPENKELAELYIGKQTIQAEEKPIYKLSNKAIFDSLITISNPYEQIAFMKKCDIKNGYLVDFVFTENASDALKTYVAEEYLKDTMQQLFREKMLITYIRTRNPAFISIACEQIRKDSLFLKNKKDILPELVIMKKFLQMPQDFEALADIDKTIAQLYNQKYTYSPPPFNRPINWQNVAKIKENQKVRILTNKGEIILECKVNDAPATVANFLQLVDSGYYNGKFFHRMVPNFVVQGGCPRGDGWGALNWSQRTEVSNFLSYKPGSVGIASAGMDSEGVQFFITHTYTPHLDGRYTIFAQVISGMVIVNSLQVGDYMIRLERVE